jgi:hypothetical protein
MKAATPKIGKVKGVVSRVRVKTGTRLWQNPAILLICRILPILGSTQIRQT